MESRALTQDSMILDKRKGFGVSLVLDGWTTINHQTFVNISISNPREASF
jgi:hypothetical protein